jgi:uncharacterized membrane protein YcfT
MAVQRIDWADYAKGLTIVLVVYGHAVVGVAKDVPIDATVYAFAMKPFSQFRMPVFFFVAGLFAAFSLKRDWPSFVDRTLLPLLYVFVLWNLLQWGVRTLFAPWANNPIEVWRILLFPVGPINITWFIWALIAYYLASYVARRLPTALVVAAAAMLAATPIPDNWFYVYQQAPRFFVYFALGLACSSWIVALETRGREWLLALLTLTYVVLTPLAIHLVIDEMPLIDFANSLLGIAWIATLCMVLAERGWCSWLRWVGGWSLPIFVTHTIVTAGMREALLRAGLADSALLLIAAGTFAGVVAPIGLAWTLRRLGFPWLFERPAWVALAKPTASNAGAQPAG